MTQNKHVLKQVWNKGKVRQEIIRYIGRSGTRKRVENTQGMKDL